MNDHLLLEVDTATLLASGGDSRHQRDELGRNRYGCAYEPESDAIAFGSCTASSISPVGYESAVRLHGWLRSLSGRELEDAVDDLFQGVRERIADLLTRDAGVPLDVVLSPSGTDAEFIPLLIAASQGRRVENIIVGPAEAGSGSASAAAGLHFDVRCPDGTTAVVGEAVDDALASMTTLHRVHLRDSDGTERDVADIDAEVHAIVAAALERDAQPLVHVIAHSKTGVHAPSLACIDRLTEQHPGRILIVIDAAQGRVSRRGLRRRLRRGAMMIVSGSKFFGGPPFAGAVLVPRSVHHHERGLQTIPPGFGAYFTRELLPRNWSAARDRLPAANDVGLLLRWFAALGEMHDYYLVPSRLRFDVLRTFERAVPDEFGPCRSVRLHSVSPPLIADDAERLLESKTTVFSFACHDPADGSRLGHDDLAQLHRLMRTDLGAFGSSAADVDVLRQRILLGQPVRIGSRPDGPSVLRIALGAVRIVQASVLSQGGRSFEERLVGLRTEIANTRTKLERLLELRASWDDLGASR